MLLAFLVIREAFFMLERKEWIKERSNLNDRIQAKDLIELRQAQAIEKPKPKKEEKPRVEFL